MIIRQNKLSSQPQFIPRIDRGAAITRGLVDALLPSPAMIDIIRGQPITAVGVPATTFGPRGRGKAMNTTTAYYTKANYPLINASEFSFFAVLVPTSFNDATAAAFSYGNSGDDTPFILFGQGSSAQQLSLRIRNSSGSVDAEVSATSAQWQDNKIAHVMMRRSEALNSTKVDCNGVSVATGSAAALGTTTLNQTGLGVLLRSSAGLGWKGEIYLILVWNRFLTETEHQALVANPWQVFQTPNRRVWAGFTTSSGSTGTLATTNANDTSAASGTTTVTGTLAKTNANDTSAASGTITVLGTVAKTNANDTSAASGSSGQPVSGSLATTNANDTLAASGTTTVLGTLAKTNANDTPTASGTTTVLGALATTNANDTLAASGSSGSAVSGSLATTNANDTLAAAGTTTVLGALAKTNANDTSTAAGTSTVLGTLATTNANDSIAASGAAGIPSGTVDYTNANDTCSASGIVTPPAVAEANPPGQLGDPRPRREHWPKQGIGYEEEYRLQQEAFAKAAKEQADIENLGSKAAKPTPVISKADAQAEAKASQEAFAKALESEQIQKAIADLLQEDEDAMSLIMELI